MTLPQLPPWRHCQCLQWPSLFMSAAERSLQGTDMAELEIIVILHLIIISFMPHVVSKGCTCDLLLTVENFKSPANTHLEMPLAKGEVAQASRAFSYMRCRRCSFCLQQNLVTTNPAAHEDDLSGGLKRQGRQATLQM